MSQQVSTIGIDIMKITPELVSSLYDLEPGYDGLEIAANIINKLVTRTEYPADAAYFYHVHEVWNMIKDYIDSTYITA